MPRRFQFSLGQVLSALIFWGAACWLFRIAFDKMKAGADAVGPMLFVLASSLAGATLDALFRKPALMAAIGAALAVAFMATVLVLFGTW
jgi:hypothetical protein